MNSRKAKAVFTVLLAGVIVMICSRHSGAETVQNEIVQIQKMLENDLKNLQSAADKLVSEGAELDSDEISQIIETIKNHAKNIEKMKLYLSEITRLERRLLRLQEIRERFSAQRQIESLAVENQIDLLNQERIAIMDQFAEMKDLNANISQELAMMKYPSAVLGNTNERSGYSELELCNMSDQVRIRVAHSHITGAVKRTTGWVELKRGNCFSVNSLKESDFGYYALSADREWAGEIKMCVNLDQDFEVETRSTCPEGFVQRAFIVQSAEDRAGGKRTIDIR